MKKILVILLVAVLTVLLSACGGEENLNTDSTKNTSISSESSNVSSDTSSVNELSIPNGLIGLIDENEKPYGSDKCFYMNKKTLGIMFFCSDNDEFVGEFVYTDNGKKIISYNWKYAGKGVYIVDQAEPYKYFMHQGYLVWMYQPGLINGKLKGNREDGYTCNPNESDGWRFYENGTMEMINEKTKRVIIQGTYVMISDNIMKTKLTYDDGTTQTRFYLIDNENYMYQAYPQVWNG